MLQMYYLRTHVFSKQEKEFVETAMANARDDIHEFRITAPTTPSSRAVLPSRTILSISKRNKCRKLLLPAAAAKAKLSSKLWSRKRRRKLTAVVDDCRLAKLLYKLQFQQYNRFARSRRTPVVSCAHESAKERQSVGDAVSSDRRRPLVERCVGQGAPIPADGLRPRTASNDSRRGAAGHRLSTVALERLVRSQRNQAHPEMSQRERSHLCLLQSSSLESIMSAR